MSNLNIKAQSAQLMAQATGIAGLDGTLKTVTLVAGDFTLKVDPKVFPFIKNGATVMVVLSIVQILEEEPTIVPAGPKLIGLNS